MLVLLISGSSAFSKPAWTPGSSWFMYCWRLAWRILSISLLAWDEWKCAVVLTFLSLPFLKVGMKTLFPVLWPLLTFPYLLAYWVQHFNSNILRIWNSSTGISSPPLALFSVMFPKVKGKVSERQSLVIPPWGCRVGRGWGWRGGSGSDKAHLRFPGSS